MSNLRKDLQDIEALFCDSKTSNIEIIRSHSLEILLSLSDSDEFIEEMAEREALLREVLACLPNPELTHKVLLLLVNLICNETMGNKLHSLGGVPRLFEQIFATMKKVNLNHLTCSKSLLANVQNQAKPEGQGDWEEIKVYEINTGTVNVNEKDAMLELDSVRLSIMCFINLAATSAAARADILQRNTAYEANNFLIIMDWLAEAQTFPIFKNFINVIISLSSDEDVRGVLIEKSLKQLSRVASYSFAIKDPDVIEQANKILRNLSFDPNLKLLVAELAVSKYLEKSLDFIQQNGKESEQSVRHCRSIVDICLAVMTSAFAGENFPAVEFLYNIPGLVPFLESFKLIEAADPYYVDRIECLLHIIQNGKPEA